MTASKPPVLDLKLPAHRTFVHLLVNTLLVSVINFTVWFAITFWVFLETKSVLATGMVAGIFLVMTSVSGIWFGSLVDRFRKKLVMQVSTAASLVLLRRRLRPLPADPGHGLRPRGQRAAVGIHRAGHVRGDRRQRPDHRAADPGHGPDRGRRRDRANGLVGTTTGRVVPGHLGDQRCAGRGRRHVLRPAVGHAGDGAEPSRTWPASRSTRPDGAAPAPADPRPAPTRSTSAARSGWSAAYPV